MRNRFLVLAVLLLLVLCMPQAWSQGGEGGAPSPEGVSQPATGAGAGAGGNALPIGDLSSVAISEEQVSEFGGTVHARLTGDPIRDATVTLVRLGPDSSAASWPSARTDAQGAFVVADIEPGPYMVLAMARGYRTYASMFGYHFGVEAPPTRPVQLGRPGMRSSFRAVGAIEAWVAALAAMAVVLALTRRFWRPRPLLGRGRVANALAGLGIGPIVGLPTALVVCAVIRLTSTAGPALPDGVVWWARHSGYGAIVFIGAGVAPVIGFVVAMNPRVVATPARAATVASCGGLAAGLSMCQALVTKGLDEYFRMAISCPPIFGPMRLTPAHMQVVCGGSELSP